MRREVRTRGRSHRSNRLRPHVVPPPDVEQMAELLVAAVRHRRQRRDRTRRDGIQRRGHEVERLLLEPGVQHAHALLRHKVPEQLLQRRAI